MRLSAILIPVALVLALLALAALPTGYAQPVVGTTAQYLPAVFKGDESPTLAPTNTPVPLFLQNGDFEQGQAYWSLTGRVAMADNTARAHAGTHAAVLGGDILNEGNAIAQAVYVSADTPILTFWWSTTSGGTDCTSKEGFVWVDTDPTDNGLGWIIQDYGGFCQSHGTGYHEARIDFAHVVGQTVILRFASDVDWAIDDVAFVAVTAPAPTSTQTSTTPTVTRTPSVTPSVTNTSPPTTPTDNPLNTHGQDLYNCSDFSRWSQAEAVYLANLPGDPNHLDADADGIPCESLPGAP